MQNAKFKMQTVSDESHLLRRVVTMRALFAFCILHLAFRRHVV